MILYRAAVVITALTLLTAAATLCARLSPRPIRAELHPSEQWEPNLYEVRSLAAAYPVVDRYIARSPGSGEAKIANGVVAFVSDRFVHGVPLNYIQENWISRGAGLLWANLAMPVIPDIILEHRHAMCSQQAIVTQALLHHYGLHYASVRAKWAGFGFSDLGHFAVAAKVDGIWRYYDTDLEPSHQGVPLARIIDGSAADFVYANRPDIARRMQYAASHKGIKVSQFDRNPAPRGAAFQKITRAFSNWGWLALGMIAFSAWISVVAKSGRSRPGAFAKNTSIAAELVS